jgi:hypothetical protein
MELALSVSARVARVSYVALANRKRSRLESIRRFTLNAQVTRARGTRAAGEVNQTPHSESGRQRAQASTSDKRARPFSSPRGLKPAVVWSGHVVACCAAERRRWERYDEESPPSGYASATSTPSPQRECGWRTVGSERLQPLGPLKRPTTNKARGIQPRATGDGPVVAVIRNRPQLTRELGAFAHTEVMLAQAPERRARASRIPAQPHQRPR